MAAGAAQLVPATVALSAGARGEIAPRFSRREIRFSMAATDDIRLRFDHVSIAVKSIDRAYDFFAKYFPIKLRGAKSLDDQVSGSFYWQDFHLGGFVVELIEDPPTHAHAASRWGAGAAARANAGASWRRLALSGPRERCGVLNGYIEKS